MSIENKLDKLLDKQAEMNISLAKIEVDLAHHIKRSDQHEEVLERQNKTISKLWIAIAALAGGGITNSAPSIAEFLKHFIGAQ